VWCILVLKTQARRSTIDLNRMWLLARSIYGPDLLTANPLLALKNYCWDLLKTRSAKLVLKRCGLSCFCGWPYCICICRSFPFRRKIYGRRVFKWIRKHDLLIFALVNLLVFARLFNAQKKHVLTHFATWLHGTESAWQKGKNNFFTHINFFGMPEEDVIRTYRLPSHVSLYICIYTGQHGLANDIRPIYLYVFVRLHVTSCACVDPHLIESISSAYLCCSC